MEGRDGGDNACMVLAMRREESAIRILRSASSALNGEKCIQSMQIGCLVSSYEREFVEYVTFSSIVVRGVFRGKGGTRLPSHLSCPPPPPLGIDSSHAN